jgi:hypothetical protein
LLELTLNWQFRVDIELIDLPFASSTELGGSLQARHREAQEFFLVEKNWPCFDDMVIFWGLTNLALPLNYCLMRSVCGESAIYKPKWISLAVDTNFKYLMLVGT